MPADCDIVITPASLGAAGVTNVPRERRALEADWRYHRYIVPLPGRRAVETTHHTSLSWLVEVRRDEGRERSLANLRGSRQALETRVTEPPFVPQIWKGLVISRAAPPDPVVVVRADPRAIEADLVRDLRDEALQIFAAAKAPLDLADITAQIQIDACTVAKLLYLLKTEETIIGERVGGKVLYRIAP